MSRTPVAVTGGVDDLLESDMFRYTRNDADVARLERQVHATTEHPYWQLLRALLGVGESVDERTARRIWAEIGAHRRKLSETVGRQIPLRAAAIDWLYLRDETERPIRAVVVSREALAQAVEKGRRDPLTGLPRKAQFERSLEREARCEPFVGGCVVFIDLDGFKHANDRLGHAAGDTALRRFSRVAGAALRKGDLVGRLGGDEFGLMFRGLDPKTVRRVITRLRSAFERECAGEDISFSFGISALDRGETAREALSRADAAMYRQKRRRKAAIKSALPTNASAATRSDRRERRRR